MAQFSAEDKREIACASPLFHPVFHREWSIQWGEIDLPNYLHNPQKPQEADDPKNEATCLLRFIFLQWIRETPNLCHALSNAYEIVNNFRHQITLEKP